MLIKAEHHKSFRLRGHEYTRPVIQYSYDEFFSINVIGVLVPVVIHSKKPVEPGKIEKLKIEWKPSKLLLKRVELDLIGVLEEEAKADFDRRVKTARDEELDRKRQMRECEEMRRELQEARQCA